MTVSERIEKHKQKLLHDAADGAATYVVLRGKNWDRRAKSDKLCRVKYQAGLTVEEAAELDALRAEICPDYSRYAFVRLLLLHFTVLAKALIAEREKNHAYR